jgi:hypothetical protein
MKLSTLRRPVAVLAVVLVLTGSSPPALACGPYFEEAVFTRAERPDSEADYVAGRLGVVLPGYRTRYLFVAYRYWIGKPLAGEEQKALQQRPGSPGEGSTGEANAAWIEASRAITGSSLARIDPTRRVPGQEFEFYGNCPDDAFRSAAATLERRVALASRASPAVQDWVRAQQLVFSNCSAGSAVPEAVPAGAPEWLRMDRSYQVAAAHFYSGQFDDAEKEFRAIAADPASPWSPLAPYLAARCLVRKATLLAPPGEVNAVTLGRAQEELRRIARGDGSPSIRRAADRLLGFVRFRLHPAERLEELAGLLESGASAESLPQDLTDYALLLWRPPEGTSENDLSAWVRNVQDRRPESLEVALRRWKERPSIPWLVAALTKVPPSHARAAELLQAAEKVDPLSPAWPTIAFHRARLLARRGETNAARDLVDRVLANREGLPVSSVNLFLAESLRLARKFDEFLRDAQRLPADRGFDFGEGDLGRPASSGEQEVLFDDDAVTAFNRAVPVRLWKEAATSRLLAGNLQRELRLAAWTRAALLGNDDIALELTPALGRDVPEVAGLLESHARAADGPARRFAAAFVLLHLPGAKPSVLRGPLRAEPRPNLDNLRANWWCAGGVAADYGTVSITMISGSPPPRPPPAEPSVGFLSEAERREGAEEGDRAERLEAAPNLLGREVLAWAKTHPRDPRVPEALHLVVRATRYGCADDATGALSREAFQTLHRLYRDSPWTKQTPYWFRAGSG